MALGLGLGLHAGSGGFSPLNLSTLLHWYDFSDGGSITTSGGRITAMTAKGTPNSLTVDGTGPTWTSGDKFATASGSGYLQLATAVTGYPKAIIGSIKMPGTGQAANIFSSSNTGTASNWYRLNFLSASGVNADVRVAAVADPAVDGQGALAVSTNVVGVSVFTSTSSRKARRDDNAFGAATVTTLDPSLNVSQILGLNSGGSKAYTDSGARVYDVLVLSAEPSEAEYAAILAFLQAKHS